MKKTVQVSVRLATVASWKPGNSRWCWVVHLSPSSRLSSLVLTSEENSLLIFPGALRRVKEHTWVLIHPSAAEGVRERKLKTGITYLQSVSFVIHSAVRCWFVLLVSQCSHWHVIVASLCGKRTIQLGSVGEVFVCIFFWLFGSLSKWEVI